MKTSIQDLIVETKKTKWSELKDLQPVNFKNNYHSRKTKESIIKNGFARAIYVWQNQEDNQLYILDGHCRFDLLNELVNEGYDIPEYLNCTYLDNKVVRTKKDAIKILLNVFNIKTNPINEEVLIDFLDEENIILEEENIVLDDIDIQSSNTQDALFDIDQNLSDSPYYDESLVTAKDPKCIFYNSECKFGIPMLKSDMMLDCDIDDIIVKPNQEIDIDKTYIILYSQFSANEKFKNNIMAFFLHDKIFESVFNDPINTVSKIKSSDMIGALTPNFSIWTDEPIALQLYNWYKTQWCGRFFQDNGIKVMPTLNWGDERSYDFCFSGVPFRVRKVIAQCRNLNNELSKKRFIKGLIEAYNRIEFETIYIYGANIPSTREFLENNIPKDINWQAVNSQTEKLEEYFRDKNLESKK